MVRRFGRSAVRKDVDSRASDLSNTRTVPERMFRLCFTYRLATAPETLGSIQDARLHPLARVVEIGHGVAGMHQGVEERPVRIVQPHIHHWQEILQVA